MSVVAVVVVLSCATCGAVFHTLRYPHGGYDAWWMWNAKAGCLLKVYDAPADLLTALSTHGHPDYPLLLPLVIARFQEALGQQGIAPSLLAELLFLGGTIAMLAGTVYALRGARSAILATLCLLGNQVYLKTALDQYADMPLAFYLLTCVSVLFLGELNPRRVPKSVSLVAGVMLGACVATKNEGSLFLASLLLCAAIPLGGLSVMARMRSSFWILLGALPLLVVVAGQKASLHTSNDLALGWRTGTLGQLFDVNRYVEITLYAVRRLGRWSTGGVLALVVVVLTARKRRCRPAATGWVMATLALSAGGFFLVFVTTPLALDFHLRTAFDRVACQLWPTFLALVFLRMDGPRRPLPPAKRFGHLLRCQLPCVR